MASPRAAFYLGEQTPNGIGELTTGEASCARGGPKQVPAGWYRAIACLIRSNEAAEPATQAIARHRRANRSADCKRNRHEVGGIIGPGRGIDTPHGAVHLGIDGRAQPGPGTVEVVEVTALADRADHADSRARPFARRALITARPPLVLIRARNPCLRARRRAFGWNVRFISTSSTTNEKE